MRIVGHGIDIVNIATFADLMCEVDGDFVERCFTVQERKEGKSRPDLPAYLAGCFAVKEAVLKAIGCGFDGEISPLEVETSHNEDGVPIVQLEGASADIANKKGITDWMISKSDAGGVVVASAIAIGSE